MYFYFLNFNRNIKLAYLPANEKKFIAKQKAKNGLKLNNPINCEIYLISLFSY